MYRQLELANTLDNRKLAIIAEVIPYMGLWVLYEQGLCGTHHALATINVNHFVRVKLRTIECYALDYSFLDKGVEYSMPRFLVTRQEIRRVKAPKSFGLVTGLL